MTFLKSQAEFLKSHFYLVDLHQIFSSELAFVNFEKKILTEERAAVDVEGGGRREHVEKDRQQVETLEKHQEEMETLGKLQEEMEIRDLRVVELQQRIATHVLEHGSEVEALQLRAMQVCVWVGERERERERL